MKTNQNVIKTTFATTKDTHGRRAYCKIVKLNDAVKSEAITVSQYQRQVQLLLRTISDWQKRMHYENLCLLPVEWQ